jgi:GNAT superfamily N-acetyltransferase
MSDEDLPFVAALYASTRADELAQTGWPAPQQQAFLAQQHRAQHQHYRTAFPNAEWLILERSGENIGRLYVDESASDRTLLIDISLVGEARGRGLGAAILADLLAAAGEAGRSVSLHVERLNPARRLYVRLGFQLVRDMGVYLEMEWRPPGAAAGDAAGAGQKKIAS